MYLAHALRDLGFVRLILPILNNPPPSPCNYIKPFPDLYTLPFILTSPPKTSQPKPAKSIPKSTVSSPSKPISATTKPRPTKPKVLLVLFGSLSS